ncbi:MAG: hypothetical protein WC120_02485 [Parcubacteria group bacterium]
MKYALFQGRFQPPTIAHVCTVETILNKWQFVTICVVYNTPKPEWFDIGRWEEYIKASEKTSYAPGKNPFTPNEVKEMWDAWTVGRKLNHRISCDISKRPYFDKEFNVRYPPAEFMIVRPEKKDGDASIDALRGKIFPELLGRNYESVSPPFKLHNARIIKKVMEGGESWKEFIPQGAYEVFLRINGPARMEEVYRTKQEQSF